MYNYKMEQTTTQKTKKVLRVWTPSDCPEEYKYLEHAIKDATKKALNKNCEACVTLDEEDNEGNVYSSIKVAIIRGNKFDTIGAIK